MPGVLITFHIRPNMNARMLRQALVVLALFEVSKSEIKLVDNGYENVNVIIKDTVAEDSNLIPRIQEVLTNASALLFKATKYRAYFKNITIVIPKKWRETKSNLTLPSVSTFSEHIRVDRRNKAKKDAPYVRGNLECGKSGWFLHLTPGFLNTVGETPYGPHANAIVHEWGHLRWGLFDEYASIPYPGETNPNNKMHFYNENGQWRPVTCSRQITGGAYRRNCDVTKPCNLNSITIGSQCKFCPDQQQTAKASFMSSQWIQSLESFCEKDSPATDPAVRHNSKVPNAQNYYCNGQSAWEVMEQHPDFSNDNNPSNFSDTDTVPTFLIVQETGRVRVFVYDVSGSMGGDKILQQKLASYVVIDNVIETGSWLGLVQFDSYAIILAPLTEINRRSVRSNLKRLVPTSAGGGTDIYRGLKKAIEVIESSQFSTSGTEIILLSDGESNYPYDHIIPELQERGITVHTISITRAADAGMAQLAFDTGGRSFIYLETNSVSFVDVMTQAISAGTAESDSTEKVLGTTYDISSTLPVTDYFNVDDGLGNSTTVTVIRRTSSAFFPITINVTGPAGSLYTVTNTTEMVSIEIDDIAPVGRYDINISTTSSIPIQIDVTVTTLPASEDAEVVRVTSFFSNATVDITSGEEIKLHASIEKAGNPVLNANVTAVLAGDSSFQARELVMKDLGTGADLIANDGVYSVYLVKAYFTSNNRYNVKVTVRGDSKAFTYSSEASVTNRAAAMPGAEDEVEFTPVKLEEFQRQSLPGEITVVNYNNNPVDTTPPARINDLRVESIYNNNGVNDEPTLIYTFVWTAVGDSMDVGTASKYDMRMDADNGLLRNTFDNSSSVPVNLTQPKPSGNIERYSVNFTIADCNGTCYVAIRAVDQNGLNGEISNIVNIDIDFSYEPEEIFPDDDEDVRTTHSTTMIASSPNVNVDTSLAQNGLSTAEIVAIAVGATVFLVILIVVSLCYVNSQKHIWYLNEVKEKGNSVHQGSRVVKSEHPPLHYDNRAYSK